MTQILTNEEGKPKFDPNRRFCPMDEKLIEMFVEQISNERFNESLYRSFANYYSSEGLNKLHDYYVARANEEAKHATWIFNWLTYNDAEFQYPKVDEVNIEINDRKRPFAITVDQEIQTTDEINALIDRAFEVKDYQTIAWLNGNGPIEGNLCPEQAEEESVSRAVRDMSEESNTSWQIIETTIYNFYKNS